MIRRMTVAVTAVTAGGTTLNKPIVAMTGT